MNIPEAIITGCKNGDPMSQERLYRLSFDRLMSISIRYMKDKDEAMSMVNQGFFRILNKLDQYDPNRSYANWISRIMTNLLIDNYRKHKRTEQIMEEWSEVTDNDIPVDNNLFEKEIEAEALNDMLIALPEIRNKVFNLYAIDGYTHAEIGELLGIPEGTSKWHLAKARQQLKEMIKKTNGLKKGLNIG